MFCSCMLLGRCSGKYSKSLPGTHPSERFDGENINIFSNRKLFQCSSESDSRRWELVVNRNVWVTAWITLLTPEEADKLSAAQQRWLNVTRQPNHLLMKAWQRRAEPPCRAQTGEQKPDMQSWASAGSFQVIIPLTRAQTFRSGRKILTVSKYCLET